MSEFTIFPAVDLKGGRCVRLTQGRADAETVYGDDPVAAAQRWVDEGATWLHVVDLDGAFAGRPVQHEIVARIAQSISIPVEVGGGLRTDADVDLLLRTGVARVIIGTRAWSEPDMLARLAGKHGDQIVVGIDARDGKVQVQGWTETTAVTAVELARKADAMGIRTLIVTDTATDGMLKGPNLKAIEDICRAVNCDVIASGGVSSPADIKALRDLQQPHLVGAIVGKALYEGHTTLPDLMAAAR